MLGHSQTKGRATGNQDLGLPPCATSRLYLRANARSQVRRGLKRCEVRATAAAKVAVHGRQAHEDTVARQDRAGTLGGQACERFGSAVGETSGIETWGAWCDDMLAAFLVTMSFGDSVEFLLAGSRDDTLGNYPNNALLFALTEEILVRRKLREISFGLESLEPVGPLEQFTFSMGYRTKPLRQRVVFHPVLAAVVRSSMVRDLCLGWGEPGAGRGVFWRKAAGWLRFAEEAGG